MASYAPYSPEHGYRERRRPEKTLRPNLTDNWKLSDSDCGKFKSDLATGGLLEHVRSGKGVRVFEVRPGLKFYKPSPGPAFESAPSFRFGF